MILKFFIYYRPIDGRELLSILLYADDMMIFSVSKTKVLGLEIGLESGPNLSVKIRDEKVEVVDGFVYLGSYATRDSKCELEIGRRIGAAIGKFHNLSKSASNQWSISLKTKLRI